jgi:hypothetical protein
MSNKKKPGVSEELAAMIYYAEIGNTGAAFESLEKDDRALWIMRANAAIIGLDKMDKMIVRKVLPADSWEQRSKNLDILTRIIESFIKTVKTTKPGMFPSGELAARILDGKVS